MGCVNLIKLLFNIFGCGKLLENGFFTFKSLVNFTLLTLK